MTRIEDAALRVLADLQAEGRRAALVGGLAVSIRAVPRMTRDIDFAVAVESDRQAEGLIRCLRRRGYSLGTVLEQLATGRLATARFDIAVSAGATAVAVDLLFASSGIEPEVVKAADTVEFLPGVTIPVAVRGHLLALKVLALDEDRRPQDRQDILALLSKAGEEDRRLARRAVALITARGFHRGKRLDEELQRFVELMRQLRRRQSRSRTR